MARSNSTSRQQPAGQYNLQNLIAQRDKLSRLIESISDYEKTSMSQTQTGSQGGRTLSAAGRQRIAAAQKNRWASARQGGSSMTNATSSGSRRQKTIPAHKHFTAGVGSQV